MVKYTKEQINDILDLKGWMKTTIDIFNLYGVLTIGVSNDPGEWEVKQMTFSENKLEIALEDFENCQTEADVKQAFNEAMKKAVSATMFKYLKNYEAI